MAKKRYAVVKLETGISHSHHDSKRDAERAARAMTEYHQQQYVVRPVLTPARDVLGRPLPPKDETIKPRSRILSDDQITAIAVDVRTKPLAEVGRHVMPLIQHIVDSDARCCQNCRRWVAYNQQPGVASRGECLVYSDPESPVRFGGEAPAALLTPFDWSCKGWAERSQQTSEDAAQCSK